MLDVDPEQLIAQVHDALFASKIVSYAQGLDLMRTMGAKKGWGLDLGAIAGIWRGGCIIRAQFLRHITAAYRADPGLAEPDAGALLPASVLNRSQPRLAPGGGAGGGRRHSGAGLWRLAGLLRQPSAAPACPANLLQAQRDFLRRPHL